MFVQAVVLLGFSADPRQQNPEGPGTCCWKNRPKDTARQILNKMQPYFTGNRAEMVE